MPTWLSRWLVPAAMLAALTSCQGAGGNAMNDDQSQPPAQAGSGKTPPRNVKPGSSPGEQQVAAVSIRSVPAPPAPARAQAVAGSECVRPFVNDQLNSRVSERLPAGSWIVRWQASLDPGFPP